jgi:hypothetical protein
MKRITQFIASVMEMIILSCHTFVFAEEIVSPLRNDNFLNKLSGEGETVVEDPPEPKEEKKDEPPNPDDKITLGDKEMKLEDAADFIDNMKADDKVTYDGAEYTREEIAKLLSYEPKPLEKAKEGEKEVVEELTGEVKLSDKIVLKGEEFKKLYTELEKTFPAFETLTKEQQAEIIKEYKSDNKDLKDDEVAAIYNDKESVEGFTDSRVKKEMVWLYEKAKKQEGLDEGDKLLKQRQRDNAASKTELDKAKKEFLDKMAEEKEGIELIKEHKKTLEQLKKDYKKTLDTDIDTIEDEEKRTELIAEKKYIKMNGGIEAVDKAMEGADAKMKDLNDTIKDYESKIQYFEYEMLVNELQTFDELKTTEPITDIWDKVKADKDVDETEVIKMTAIQEIISRFKNSKSPLTIARFYKVYKNSIPAIDKLLQQSKPDTKGKEIKKIDISGMRMKTVAELYKRNSKAPIKLPAKVLTVGKQESKAVLDRKANAKRIGVDDTSALYE